MCKIQDWHPRLTQGLRFTPSCSAESEKEIVDLPQSPTAIEESEQLSAAPVLHVRFQEDLIHEVSSSLPECE